MGVQFLGRTTVEANAVDETGLLVQATEVVGGVDDLIFSLEGFAGYGQIRVVKGLTSPGDALQFSS